MTKELNGTQAKSLEQLLNMTACHDKKDFKAGIIMRLVKSGLAYDAGRKGFRISATGRRALHEYQVAACRAEDAAEHAQAA